MADSVASFIDGFIKAATAIETAQSDAINRAAIKAKRTIETERNKVAGADGKLSGVGKSGAKLGVRYTVKSGASPSAIVKATGPWQLIERDTKSAGVIRPKRNQGAIQGPRLSEVGKAKALKRRASRGGNGARALASGGFGPYSKIVDKGTRGQRPFAKGVEKAGPAVSKDMKAAFTKAVARAF